PVARRPAHANAGELAEDLARLARGLEAQGAGRLAAGRLRALRRKARVFRFHRSTIYLRQSCDQHGASVEELLRVAGVCESDASLEEEQRVELLVGELSGPRPLHVPHAEYSPLTLSELDVLKTAAGAQARLGRAAVANYIIS